MESYLYLRSYDETLAMKNNWCEAMAYYFVIELQMLPRPVRCTSNC